MQNWLLRLQSLSPDASLDNHIDGLRQLWRLGQLWPYRHNGHNGHMAIVAIDAIVDRRQAIRMSKQASDPLECSLQS